MNLPEFLDRIINAGIKAARESYQRPSQSETLKGAIAGFEACRGKSPNELKELLDSAKIAKEDARSSKKSTNYWWFRAYEAEVEWVCNCLSAVLHNEGLPPIIIPTARAMIQAAKIIGINGVSVN